MCYCYSRNSLTSIFLVFSDRQNPQLSNTEFPKEKLQSSVCKDRNKNPPHNYILSVWPQPHPSSSTIMKTLSLILDAEECKNWITLPWHETHHPAKCSVFLSHDAAMEDSCCANNLLPKQFHKECGISGTRECRDIHPSAKIKPQNQNIILCSNSTHKDLFYKKKKKVTWTNSNLLKHTNSWKKCNGALRLISC